MAHPVPVRSESFSAGLWGTALAISLLAGLPGRVTAATAVLTPSLDNTIYGTTDRSNGEGAALFAGFSGSGKTLRSLLSFDIAGSVPAGATIVSVSLTLTINTPKNHSATVDLHRLAASWGEGTSNASSSGEGGGGDGGIAATGDATWNYRFYNTSSWTTPGGDFSGTVSGSQFVTGTSGTAVFASAGMATDVQGWLNTPSTNFGWIMMAQDESALNSAVRFSSREGSAPPSLQVNYTPIPEPGSCALLVGSAAFTCVLRRRLRRGHVAPTA